MSIPLTGKISFSDIQDEWEGSNPISLTEYYGVDDGVPANGEISVSDFRGTADTFELTLTTNQKDIILVDFLRARGWDSEAPVILTIASGIVISSEVRGQALRVTGDFPGGVTIINNGTIVGRGGKGGAGSPNQLSRGANGEDGRTGLKADVAVTIDNQGVIAGGGGGGGGGCGTFWYANRQGGGGGGGQSSLFNALGAARSGTNGTFAAAGVAGGGQVFTITTFSGAGGNGGNWGQAGGNGAGSFFTGYPGVGGGIGGAAGKAVEGNSNITWTNTGTRTGPVV